MSELQTNPELEVLINEILTDVTQIVGEQRLPNSTYRLQLNRDFTFLCAIDLVDHLHQLGISHLYLSPIFQSRPGSMHGYDVVRHNAINPEIGTLDDLRELANQLHARGMGLILDVVPNHMCAAASVNQWWSDVLENGPSSAFAHFFDIDWMPLKPDLANKVLLPILGEQFGRVLEGGLLSLRYAEGAFSLHYFDHVLPIAPRSYALILTSHLDELSQTLGSDHPDLMELLSILTSVRNLPLRTETNDERVAERRREKEIIKRRLHELVQRSAEVAEFVNRNVVEINGKPGKSASFDRLDELLHEQAYRLADWRVASDEINYRRFFDVNELAAICVEHPDVFEATHQLVFELLDEGLIDGLRIDHPDGLYDPAGYLRQLQERRFLQLCRHALMRRVAEDVVEAQWLELAPRLAELWRNVCTMPGAPLARPLYVIVEKILGRDEPVPGDWLTHGTVGYDFLNPLNGIFIDGSGAELFDRLFTKVVGGKVDFREMAYHCKRLIARMSMASEVSVLGYQLDRISERNRWSRDFTRPSLTRALQEVIASFGVYRTYVTDGRILDRDRQYLETAVARAKRRNPAMSESIFDFVRDLLLLKYRANADEQEREAQRRFVGKFQQLTGPMMAKAIEDTVFYRFNRLVSLNEVGGEPRHFGTLLEEFHDQNENRLPRFAHGLLTTSTHDTKRSEDVRARINVLSEIPREWQQRVLKWARWNQQLKTEVDGVLAPSGSDEYLLYQTLIGIWPMTTNRTPLDSLDESTATESPVPELMRLRAEPRSDASVGGVVTTKAKLGALSTTSARRSPLGAGLPLTESVRLQLEDRVAAYMLKVAREAKSQTSWISPHAPYEEALRRFIHGLFHTDDRRHPFLTEVADFAATVAEHGYWNSLSQTLLKLTSPGVPDFFQGTEQWVLTLVDPDNRRLVDFNPSYRRLLVLIQALAQQDSSPDAVSARASFLADLLADRANGGIKLFLTYVMLQLRKKLPDVFTSGDYIPLEVTGSQSEHVVAYARRSGPQVAVIIVPRLTVKLIGLGGPVPLGPVWQDTVVTVPTSLGATVFKDAITLQKHRADERHCLRLSDLTANFPMCCLYS